MESGTLQTEHVDWTIKNGVLIAEYKKGKPITLIDAKIQVANRKEFTKGVNYPILIKDYGVLVVEKKAREYLASAEATEGIIAAAMVLTNVFSTFLGNYFMKINPPKMPVKAFKDEKQASLWLQQYKAVK
jgi:hypothetical protein